MDFKAAILKPKEGPKAAKPEPKEPKEAKEAPKEGPPYRIPSYFAEDEHRYRVFSEEEADYLDRCSPSDKGRVITLLKSGKLRIGWDVCYDDVTMRVTKRPKATMVSRKGSVKA